MAQLQLQTETRLQPGQVYDSFAPGVLHEGAIRLTNGRKLFGAPGARIICPPGNRGFSLNIAGDGCAVDGVRLEGGGIWIDDGSGVTSDVLINNNELVISAAGKEVRDGIRFSTVLQNSRITNNLVTSKNQNRSATGFGIYSHHGYRNVVIANNEIVDVIAGMHIDATNASNDLLVEQNRVSGVASMGYEFQTLGQVSMNPIFQDNVYENPFINNERNDHRQAFSLILDGAINTIIRRNRAIMPKYDPAGYVVIVLECGGDNTLIYDNYFNGGNHVLAMNDGKGSASVWAYGNRWDNFREGPRNSFPAANRVLVLDRDKSGASRPNGKDVQLSWDINRPSPKRNVRYGQTTPPIDPPADPVTLISPTPGTTVSPGQKITAKFSRKTNSNADIEGDNLDPVATTTDSDTLEITIPANATTAQTLKIRAPGMADQRFAIVAAPVDPPPPIDPKDKQIADLESANALLRQEKSALSEKLDIEKVKTGKMTTLGEQIVTIGKG